MKRASHGFHFGAQTPKEQLEDGIQRQLFGYDDAILMARVEFAENAVGAKHAHPHSQVTYVESGQFDVFIDGIEQRLGPGDSFYVYPNLEHGVTCRQAGVLLDVFSPIRDDFLTEDTK
jgi:quercetin dioxygenase-like cupin family protein